MGQVGKGRVLYLLPSFRDLFLYPVDSEELFELDALLITEPEPSGDNHDKKKNYS